jgi:hypothetical protein
MAGHDSYKAFMIGRFSLAAILVALCLGAPAPAFADTGETATPLRKKTQVTRQATRPAKRPVARWTTPPGYRSPEKIERERRVQINRDRRAYYRAGGQRIYYWSDPNPRFYRGQWNGGSFGPCYTWTPIGAVWNCGK